MTATDLTPSAKLARVFDLLSQHAPSLNATLYETPEFAGLVRDLYAALHPAPAARAGDAGARARLVAAACELRRVNDALDEAGVGSDVDDATRVRRLIAQRDYARGVADAAMADLNKPQARAADAGAVGDVPALLDRLAEWAAPAGVFRDSATSATRDDGERARALAAALRAVPRDTLLHEAEYFGAAENGADARALAALLRALAGAAPTPSAGGPDGR